MPTIAVGDIHGNVRALHDVLDQLRVVVTPEDSVVFLGDYIDRGEDSRGCCAHAVTPASTRGCSAWTPSTRSTTVC
jgi:hypothetical protein